jgi:hypothetical protein
MTFCVGLVIVLWGVFSLADEWSQNRSRRQHEKFIKDSVQKYRNALKAQRH